MDYYNYSQEKESLKLDEMNIQEMDLYWDKAKEIYFSALKLIVMSGVYSELDQNHYDYMSALDIRNAFEKLRIEIFDQSYL